MPDPQVTGIIRFGVFEVETQSGILRKRGIRIRLQEQPFRVLLALLERPGEVVTREELRQKVWPGNAFGDFDHGLNIAVNKIREALGDSAETPRFVETLPRRGYRFFAPLEGGVTPPAVAPAAAPSKSRMPKWMFLTGAALAAIALIGGVAVWVLEPERPPVLEYRRLTNDNLVPKWPPVLSDGTRLYFMAGMGIDRHLFQVPVSGGEPARVPVVLPPLPHHGLLDITPDGQQLLIGAWHTTAGQAEVWAVRIADGSSRRVANLQGSYARYSPDGNRIAFAAGGLRLPGSLWVALRDGSNPRRLLERKDLEILVPCWSPDGTRIAFGQRNRANEELSAWEIREDGNGLRRLLPDWRRNHLPSGWTPDGHLLLNSEGQFWITQQRRFYQLRQPPPHQLSAAEPAFNTSLQLRDTRTFYVPGRTALGQLQRFDTGSGNWEPHLGGISAEWVAYSNDGQNLLYVTHPQGDLWVRRADGSRPAQLTQAPMRVHVGRWSPDGRVIAFQGKSTPDQPWRTYLVDATGGSVRPACARDCGPQGDMAWAPDGKKIVFAAPVNRFYTEEQYLRLLDLKTGEVTKFPGSDGFHAPCWSPDGSELAAVVWTRKGEPGIASARPLMLYSFSEGRWKELSYPEPIDGDWLCWSHDSKWLWYYSAGRNAIMRCLVRENRHERVLQLKIEEMTGLIGYWFNLTPNDEPMFLRRRDIVQIYAFDWKPGRENASRGASPAPK